AAAGEFISGKKRDDGKQVEEEFHRAIINAARKPGPLAESTGTGLYFRLGPTWCQVPAPPQRRGIWPNPISPRNPRTRPNMQPAGFGRTGEVTRKARRLAAARTT